MIRTILSIGDVEGFAMPDATDGYINVAIPPVDAPYGPVFEPSFVRATFPRQFWPTRRRYTVRAWDAGRRLLTVDFVVHGADGVAGPWAARAEPGSVLVFEGANGSYRPDPTADWHLLVGDESALPAISASLEAMPAGALTVVRLVCDGPEYEVGVSSPARMDLQWLHRTGGPGDSDLMVAALRDVLFPPGRVHTFAHGEAEEIRAVRRHLLIERGLSRANMSCSPYWRRQMNDDAWRQVKRDFVADMEAEGV